MPITKIRYPKILGIIIASQIFVGCPTMTSHSWAESFKFENHDSLQDMSQFIGKQFSLGADQKELREIFLSEGGATLKTHPSKAGVEKYIYDINLCDNYIWRWNISVDYDVQGKLKQAYVNGEPVFEKGTPKVNPDSFHPPNGSKASILRMQRPRPEATKGEKSLAFILWDADSNLKTIDDEVLVGGGPTRADPVNMGTLHVYSQVEPWRSIFDFDSAQQIVAFSGSCESK